MTRQYRILERTKFEEESVFIAQRIRKFLWLFPIWCTFKRHTYGDDVDYEFETLEKAKAYIANDAKWEAWYTKREDRVIAMFQANENGDLVEVQS